MKIREVLAVVEARWPSSWAEPWDYPGLQIGDPEQELKGIGVALDWTTEALEALSAEANLILVHHPVFFNPLRGLRATFPQEQLLRKTVKHDLTVWCSHTNLDSTPDEVQVSRALAETIGFSGGRLFQASPAVSNPTGGYGWVCEPAEQLLGDLYHAISRLPGFQGALLNFDRQTKASEPMGKTAFWGGSWDHDQLALLLEQEIRTLVAGEIRYHDQEELRAYGIRSHAIGHDVSETPVLHVWAEKLRELVKEQSDKSVSITVFDRLSD